MAYILLDRSTNRFFSINENEDTELFSEIKTFAEKVDKETKAEAKRKASKWKKLADKVKDPETRKKYLKRAAKWAAIAGIAIMLSDHGKLPAKERGLRVYGSGYTVS